MTVAGSDSGGGAGIQADLKTFSALGVFGTSVITALTAQNTLEVRGVMEVSPEFVRLQMETVLDDLGADALKTGMLASAPIIRTVAQVIRERKLQNLVVDPVMVTTTGHRLLHPEAEAVLKEELLPLATVVTPNLSEAEVLTGQRVPSLEAMYEAARVIHRLGCRYVLMKGGHLEGPEAVDLLFDGRDFQVFSAPRIATRNTHGTGCTYSAAIAAGLALGMTVPEAVNRAKAYLTRAIQRAPNLGRGSGPVHHMHVLDPDEPEHRDSGADRPVR